MHKLLSQGRDIQNQSMEWLCGFLLPQDVLQQYTSNTTQNMRRITMGDHAVFSYNLSVLGTVQPGTTTAHQEVVLQETHMDTWDILDWTNKVYVPTLCCLGVAGNALNAAILSKRIREGKWYGVWQGNYPGGMAEGVAGVTRGHSSRM